MADNVEKPEQQRTEYIPTPSEQKLLDVLLNPEHRFKHITEICTEAGICRTTYYETFKKPEFVEYYKKESKELVGKAVGPIINAYIKEAVRGSHNHGNVLLEMAGVWQPKSRVDHNVSGTVNHKVSRIAGMSEAEVEELLQAEDEEKVGGTE